MQYVLGMSLLLVFTAVHILTHSFHDDITVCSYFQTFELCSSLQSIIIPKTVTRLGDNAFQKCLTLVSVDFEDDSVLEIIGAYVSEIK